MKSINFCKDYSCNVAGITIPKNSIFGKVGNYYYYFGDYHTLFGRSNILEVYIMEKSEWGFQKHLFTKDNILYPVLVDYIHKNKLPITNTTKVVFPLCINRAYKPDAKQAQRDFSFSPVRLGDHTVTDDNRIINGMNCKNYSMNNRHENAEKYRRSICLKK